MLRLALAALVIPLVIWLDVLALLYYDDGILSDGLHEYHNSLSAPVQIFIWIGLPVLSIVLGAVCLYRGYAPKLSRSVISAGVIFTCLALLAAMRA